MSPDAPAITLRNAWAIAVLALLHGLVYFVLLPHWMGEDEPWHLENVILVSDGYGLPGGYEFKASDRDLAPLSVLQARRRFGHADFETISAVERSILDSMRDKGYWRRVDWLGRDDSVESFDEVEYAITAAHQPPLYYFVTAPLLWLFPHAEARFQLLLVRFFSLFLFMGVVLCTWYAASRAFPQGPGAMLTTLLVAFWPMSARGAAVVNNDVLTRFWVALAFAVAAYWLTRPDSASASAEAEVSNESRAQAHIGTANPALLAANSVSHAEVTPGSGANPARSRALRRWAPAAALVCIAALGLFTKTSGASAAAIVIFAVLLHPSSWKRMRGTALLLLGLGAVITAAASVWIASHNPGVTLNLKDLATRLKEGFSAENIADLRSTLIGRFIWESRPLTPDWSPAIGLGALILFALGIAGALLRRPWLRARLFWLAFGTGAAQLILMAFRGVSRGRYLMPVAPALALMLVVGLFALLPARWQRPVAMLFLVALVTFDGYFVFHGLGREAWLNWRW
ncbi:MAG: hypothetical protein R3F17_09265 [Planctomycetota bacterium]